MKTNNPSNTDANLEGKRVAVHSADGFEQSELLKPVEALQERRVSVSFISPDRKAIRGWSDKE